MKPPDRSDPDRSGPDRSGLARIFRFVAIGGLSTGLYFVLLIALRDVVSSTVVLTAICYSASMVANFLAQGRFTFRTAGPSKRSARRYVVLQATALIINSAAMALLVDGAGVPLIAAQILVSGGLALVTYVASARWVYAAD